MRVLIIEDNLDIQANIADYLENDFTLDFAYSGTQGLELALSGEYDVIVLDLMLPGKDGIEVCREYREKAPVQAPILMLTARDTIDDKEVGFTVGADDYMIKPFSLRELKMRIEALARRPKAKLKHILSYAGVSLQPGATVFSVGDTTYLLHEKEARILGLLADAAPEIVTAQTISYALWGDEPPESGALRTHIYNLRKALGSASKGNLLHTVRGRGYMLREIAK
ncbi:MAG: DNA-binding response regulator [Kordiimonadales bacterium]|nr:MAG: DNA-binding response regulator [Kordiimonadales bacterium]